MTENPTECEVFVLRSSQCALLRTALLQLPGAELVRSGVLTLDEVDGIRKVVFALEEFLRSRVHSAAVTPAPRP